MSKKWKDIFKLSHNLKQQQKGQKSRNKETNKNSA